MRRRSSQSRAQHLPAAVSGEVARSVAAVALPHPCTHCGRGTETDPDGPVKYELDDEGVCRIFWLCRRCYRLLIQWLGKAGRPLQAGALVPYATIQTTAEGK